MNSLGVTKTSYYSEIRAIFEIRTEDTYRTLSRRIDILTKLLPVPRIDTRYSQTAAKLSVFNCLLRET